MICASSREHLENTPFDPNAWSQGRQSMLCLSCSTGALHMVLQKLPCLFAGDCIAMHMLQTWCYLQITAL